MVLQRRGAIFMACHNAIWELAERLAGSEQNPDHLGVDGIASELTNHLIPDVDPDPRHRRHAGEAPAGELRVFPVDTAVTRLFPPALALLLAVWLGEPMPAAIAQSSPAERLKARRGDLPAMAAGQK